MTATLASTTNSASGTAATSTSISVPTGVANGDLLLLSVNTGSGVTTLNTPTGWTLVQNKNDSADTHCSVWYRIASSEPGSYTVSWSTSSVYVVTMQRWTGVNTSTPIRASAASSASGPGTTFTPTAPSGVQSTDVTVYIGFGGDDNGIAGDAFTMPGSPWTTAYNLSPGVIGGTMTKGQCATYDAGNPSPPTFTSSGAHWIWDVIGLGIESASGTTYNLTSSLSESSTLTAAPTMTGLPTSSLSEASTLTASAKLTALPASSLAETSSLSGAASVTAFYAVTMSAASSFTASPVMTALPSVTLAESSTLTATTGSVVDLAATLTETSTLTAAATATMLPTVDLSEISTFTASFPAAPLDFVVQDFSGTVAIESLGGSATVTTYQGTGNVAAYGGSASATTYGGDASNLGR